MPEKTSQLEQIFENIQKRSKLQLTEQNSQKKTVQGSVYFLDLEKDEKCTRLFYADRVVAIDVYDHEGEKTLNYSILSPYQSNQREFLQKQNLGVARTLVERLAAEENNVHRSVLPIKLDDFSEVEELLYSQIDHY